MEVFIFYLSFLWFLEQCVFHYVENGESSYWQRKYVEEQAVKVQCYNGYSLPNGQDTITCTENGWSPPAKCISKYPVQRSQHAHNFPSYILNRAKCCIVLSVLK